MATFAIRKYRDIVYAICTLNGQRLRVSTGIKVEDRYWKNDELTRLHPRYKQYKDIIDSTLQELINAFYRVKIDKRPLTVESVKKEFYRQSEDDPVSFDFMKDFDDFFKKKSPTLAPTTIRNYRYTQSLLKDFEVSTGLSLDIETFDHRVFTEFLHYLIRTRELKDNTIDKHIRILKCFIKSRYPNFNQQFITYKEYDPEIIALTEDELRLLQTIGLNGYRKKTRDLFLFMCYTGMRYSDTQLYDQSWDKGGVLEFIMKKTRHRAITPLIKNAKDILDSYEGSPPKISNQKFNEYLKDLFKFLSMDRAIILNDQIGKQRVQRIEPLHEVITSHVARKTFITTLLRRGVPIQDVMVMSGHTDFRELKKYYEISREHIRKNFSNLEF